MDLQTFVDNVVAAKRAESMKNSTQLTLGELILKLEAVSDKKLPVFFDKTKYRPTSIGSWRGSYCELAVSYSLEGMYGGYQGTTVEHEFEDGMKFYNTVSTALPEKPTAQDFLDKLKEIQGKTFTGYKGGDFLMGKTTPVWVADESLCAGFTELKEGDYRDQAIVDITEQAKKVVINTGLMNY